MTNLNTYNFKLSTKKLSSGKCQVKFYLTDKNKRMYGYTLVDSKLTLKEVVEQINSQINNRDYKPYFLNSLLTKNQPKEQTEINNNYIIFKY